MDRMPTMTAEQMEVYKRVKASAWGLLPTSVQKAWFKLPAYCWMPRTIKNVYGQSIDPDSVQMVFDRQKFYVMTVNNRQRLVILRREGLGIYNSYEEVADTTEPSSHPVVQNLIARFADKKWASQRMSAVLEYFQSGTAAPKPAVATGTSISYPKPLAPGVVRSEGADIGPEVMSWMKQRAEPTQAKKTSACDCGGHKAGARDFAAGHSSWCSVAVK